MKKIDSIIEKYKSKGISTEDIEYVIVAVKDGTRREYIIRNLTAEYRTNRVNVADATSLLEELFVANGGEFKKENRGGYIYGLVSLLAGFACAYYLYYVFTYGGILVRPVLVFMIAGLGIVGGIGTIIMTIFGQYRDPDRDFRE